MVAKAQCAGCERQRVLQAWSRMGDREPDGYCGRCIAEDRAKRREASANNGGPQPGAGRPPKAPEARSTRRLQINLTAAEGEALDAWLERRGLPSGNAGVKAMLLRLVAEKT